MVVIRPLVRGGAVAQIRCINAEQMFCGFKPQMWNALANETDVMNDERNAGNSHTWNYWLDLGN